MPPASSLDLLEGAGCPVPLPRPVAWPQSSRVGVRTLLGSSVIPACLAHLGDPALRSSGSSHRLPQQGPTLGKAPSSSPHLPRKETEGGVEAFRFVQLGTDVKWS